MAGRASAARVRPAAVLLALAALVAGCAGGDEERIDKSDVPNLVLQEADLPRVWIVFDVGRQARADAPPGERSDPRRFGREDGWKARYRRPGSLATVGPLVIESRADLFGSVSGARDDLDALENGLAEALPGATIIDRPKLGEEALAAMLLQGAGERSVRFYLVAWREANATASIFVNGFARTTTLEQALALARKQQTRLARAGSG